MAPSLKGTRLNLHPEKVKLRVARKIEKNMEMAVIFVRDEVKKKLNRGQPTRTLRSGSVIGLDPSLPGEPPKKITSQLQNSIVTRVVRSKKEINGFVGSNLKKAPWLEFGTKRMKARPYLRPTLASNRRKIGKIVSNGRSAF